MKFVHKIDTHTQVFLLELVKQLERIISKTIFWKG